MKKFIVNLWKKLKRETESEQVEKQRITRKREDGGAGSAIVSGTTSKRSSHKHKSKPSTKTPRSETGPSRHSSTRQPPRKKWSIGDFEVPVQEGLTRFHDLDLPSPVMHAIADAGFQYCTPIQAEIFPSILSGKDAFGRAQTGTGKTAAFLITILTQFHKNPLTSKPETGTPRALILAPTRELVIQIAEEAQALARYRHVNIASVFGGMDYEKQKRRLHKGRTDIIIATPGRLLDFHRHKDTNLAKVETLIIDEADRMLDMGFIPDVRRIIHSTPHKNKRQTMLFSATLTPEVMRLAEQWTRDPVTVEIEPEQVAVDTVEQVVYITTTEEKFALLFNYIKHQDLDRVLIFCNRKDETRRLSEKMERYRLSCSILSGDVPQKKRIRTLEDFKSGKIRFLVATDVAGRGIHIDGMNHVINYSLPHDAEDYVHRIGRTGRAGTSGTSVSFACEADSFYLPAIEEYIGRKLECTQPPEEWLTLPAPPRQPKRKRTGEKRPPSRRGKPFSKPSNRRTATKRPYKSNPRHASQKSAGK
ncbi:MAG: ATP-dependent RNA helicase RhlB [Desulfobacteraceae bacterium]|nr:ATP-dependent RNA helicase RhlB [Desulfobacteraceae bacterium]